MIAREATKIAAVLIAVVLLWAGEARSASPTEQVRATLDRVLQLLKDPRLKTRTQERRDQLRTVLYSRFDFAEMSRRSLGSHWRRLTPQQQEEFVRLFTDLLERTYIGRIEGYADEKFVFLKERLDGSYAEVETRVINATGETFSIVYKARAAGGEWKVYDLVIENISVVNNYRAQFSRVISNESYEELVQRLRAKRTEFQDGKG
jgi:phospholipid transport system substrate-binding protein